MDYRKLRTVRQIAAATAGRGGRPVFSEASLRWLIFNADENGLDQALVRVGRRVLVDEERFNAWLETRRGAEIGSAARAAWGTERG